MFDGFSLPVLMVIFAAAAGSVWGAAVWLSDTTDTISSRFHLGQAIGGIILLTIGTDLLRLPLRSALR